MSMVINMQDQGQRLLQIQQLEFTAIELNLFLDTHPDDQQALNMYNCCHQDLIRCVREYEQEYGPLLNFGFSANPPQCEWTWLDSPWPWEIRY